MADNNGVSMSNTPQARDDVWSVAEDDATTFISIAALLANDLGGNAKSFYGINQSNPLLPSMTAQSALGATLSVSSGNIVYTPGNLFQYLAQGATATDTFQYAIQLGNGTISIAKVTVTITGANDAPVVTVEDLQGAVTELTTAPSGNLTDSGSIGFSDLDLADVHSLSAVTSSAGALGTLTATLASDTTGTGTGGKIDWAYSVAAGAVEYLAQGQTKLEEFTFTLSDGKGGSFQRTIQVTLTGTNDAPSISVGAGDSAAETLTELNAGLSASGTLTVTDVDVLDTVTGSVLSVATSGTTAGLTLTNDQLKALMSVTGGLSNVQTSGSLNWSFDSGGYAFDYLGQGQSLVLTYVVRATDNHGVTADRNVVITIEGTNDAPVLAAVATGNVWEEPLSIAQTYDAATQGTLSATDAENDNLTYGIVGAAPVGNELVAAGQYGALHLNTSTNYYYYMRNVPAIESLADGQSFTENFTFTVSDGNGGTDTQAYSILVRGANDAPSISVGAGDSAAKTLTETNAGLSASGTLTVTDVDVLDTVTGSVLSVGASGTTAGLTLTNDQLKALMSVTGGLSNVQTSGSLNWSFDSGGYAFDYLGQGQSLVLTYVVRATDDHGVTADRDVVITINGTNDAPVLATIAQPAAIQELPKASAQDITPVHGVLSVSDLDVGDVITASLAGAPVLSWSGGNLTAAQSANLLAALGTGRLALGGAVSNGGFQNVAWTWDPSAANLDFLQPGETLTVSYAIQVSDSLSSSAASTLTFTISGTSQTMTFNGPSFPYPYTESGLTARSDGASTSSPGSTAPGHLHFSGGQMYLHIGGTEVVRFHTSDGSRFAVYGLDSTGRFSTSNADFVGSNGAVSSDSAANGYEQLNFGNLFTDLTWFEIRLNPRSGSYTEFHVDNVVWDYWG